MKVTFVPSERVTARVVLTPQEMKAADVAAIEDLGLPGTALMENAGRHIAVLASRMQTNEAPVVIVCGGGNNGGDGFVAARHLASWGRSVKVYATTSRDRYAGEALTNLEACEKSGTAILFSARPPAESCVFGLVVDALFGTGLHGAVRPDGAAWIEWMNATDAPRLSVDVPSGLCATHGVPLGPVVVADQTVTFACSKWGHWLASGPEHCGALSVVDIGMPEAALNGRAAHRWVLGDADTAPAFTPRPRGWHKGSAGRVWILGGSSGRTGAVRMAGDGALRSGAGLVTIGTTASAARDLASTAYETMIETALDRTECVADTLDRWRPRIEESDAIVVGPGFPADDHFTESVVEGWSRWETPAVFDADGLNHLSRASAVQSPGGPRVMTPHPGEAARLLSCTVAEVEGDRPAALTQLVATFEAVVVLKGSHTLVGCPSGRIAICPAGNPGMASAGMGDVLSGVIGALLARGMKPMDAACAGVLWHARAGDIAVQRCGENGLMARDVLAALGDVERRQC